MLWVSTAPLSGNGHINVSPKGGKSFGIIDERTFWYHDLTGSGCETISHLLEPGNGRICIMFNAFDGPPKIIRLLGKGGVLENGTKAFQEHIGAHNVECIPGTRSIVIVDIDQVGSSCGFNVPYYDFKDFRPILNEFMAKKAKKFKEGNEKESMPRYWAFKNAWSIDGLPGMKLAMETGKKENVAPTKKMVGPFAPKNGTYHSEGFTLEQVVIIFIVAFIGGIMAVSLSPQSLRTLLGVFQTHNKASTWLPRS